MGQDDRQGCGNNPVVVMLGVIAALLGILTFVTGINDLQEIMDEWETRSPSSPSEDDRIPPTPTIRPLLPVFQTISLQNWSELSEPETNLGVLPGRNTFLDIPFDTGWKASTQCSHLRDQPETLSIATNLPNPQNVYFLIQAGWGVKEYEGLEMGNIKLAFSNGTVHNTPLILGENIRDWAWENPAAVNKATSSSLQPAVSGHAPDGTPGGMDILTVNVPNNQSRSELRRIEVSDESWSSSGSLNPCIHLVALTVKHLR